MSKYQSFRFKAYEWSEISKTLTLHYGFDDQLCFTETFHFDFDFVAYDSKVLDRALQALFFMAGVSYYKAYFPAKIQIEAGEVDPTLAAFLDKTYQHGLGEFFYLNKLDPRASIDFPPNSPELTTTYGTKPEGLLIGLGGGKDSLVSVELLRNQPKVATWSLNHRPQLSPLVSEVGLPHYWVERTWDEQLLELNTQDALNGHVPISAIFSCVGTIVCILGGYRDHVVSNENSANEPTLEYEGTAINHQYSKSIEYEEDYQTYLQHCFGDNYRYFSFLRPLSEVRIAELFASIGFDKYKADFSSCNRAFTHDQNKLSWCGTCPKCAFVFLALTPFIDKGQLEKLWNKNLLLDPGLETTYQNLLGLSGEKPLDCVGEVKESRTAMRLAQEHYPQLRELQFTIPEDYDYKALAPHRMPEELYNVLTSALPE